MPIDLMLPVCTLFPFVLTPLAVWLGKRSRGAMLLAIAPALLAIYFGNLMRHVQVSGPLTVVLPWAESLGLTLSFYADGLSLFFAIIVAAIGALIVIFAGRYFEGDPRAGRFHATLFGFMGSMLGLVLADNLFALFVFWELTGFTSFLLIGFDDDRTDARTSAVQAFVVTSTGGMGLLAAAGLIELVVGSASFSTLLSGDTALRQTAPYPWIAGLVLAAAFTKSAQVPFHFWLPNAMTAPTPVSAYLHSATMVKAGLYLVARMTPILGGTATWVALVTAAGAITMMVGAWRAVAESDLKRVLAYSTVSALGLMMMLLGLGTQAAIVAACAYLLAHACYKGALFLVAGTLEHEVGTRDVLQLGGLSRAMPLTAAAGALAALSMAGLPFFAGFVGKELVYDALLSGGSAWSHGLLALTIAASALLGVAGLVAGVAPFVGRAESPATIYEVPRALAITPFILGLAGLIAGLLPATIDLLVNMAAGSILGRSSPAHLSLWHGFTLVLFLSICTLAAAFALYACRAWLREKIWPRSLGSDRFYTVPLRALDALSAGSLPALQGASLRSYVLVLIVTATVLVALVLFRTGVPAVPLGTGVRPLEAAVCVMTIAGAISAVRARSTMTAVLSLGVTGYGIALTFLFFGAPDLAMTQFSVETLTAVIFTLVFYHFRRFRSLSSRFVRLRDLTVAMSFGTSIAAVLFFVGATATPFRLGRFFAENTVPFAHGRNIVNVILVDFRALDTMGEITVLATAALGVSALLRIGREEKS